MPERGFRRRPSSTLVALTLSAAFALSSIAALTVDVSEASAQGRRGKKKNKSEEDTTRKEAARSMFRVAVQAFKAGRFQEALDKLQEVYELDPNPIILYNIARSYEELGRLAEAADFFQRAVADPSLPEKLQAEVGRRLPKVLPALKAREARVVGVRTIGLSIKSASQRARQEATALTNKPDKPVEVREPSIAESPLFWTGIGSSLVGGGLLVGASLLDVGLTDPIDELMNPETRRNTARTEALQNQIERDQLLATIFYAAGGALVAAGGVFLYLAVDTDEVDPEVEGRPAVDAGALRLTPILSDDALGLSVGGAF